MNLSWKIAWRYLFGKKSTNAIQIITGISIFGLGFGTAAIILILSVFNGFETLLLSMYDAFNPDIKITASKGKSFILDDALVKKIKAIPSIDSVSLTLEEQALFEHNDKQAFGMLKGVDNAFNYVTGMDTAINKGKYLIQDEGIRYGLFGLGMAYKLSLNVYDRLSTVSVYLLNTKKSSPLDKQFSTAILHPGGTFAIQHEVDYEYVIAPLDVVQRLTKNSKRVSAIELKLNPSSPSDLAVLELNQTINKHYGSNENNFLIQDRLEQQATTIKVMRIEKWLAFIILLLALILVAFNLVGAIWMIVLDKKKDIAVLQAMGARSSMIRSLILKLGSLICLFGFVIGFGFALTFYFLHKKYNLIKMGQQSMVEAYPMEVYWSDLPIVAGLVLFIGLLAVVLPAFRASGRQIGEVTLR